MLNYSVAELRRNTNRYDYWQWLRQECRSLLRLVFRLYFVVLTHHPPIYPLPMGAWVWQDAIPSYLRFTTKITIKLTHRNHDKPNQKQSFQCARTHTV